MMDSLLKKAIQSWMKPSEIITWKKVLGGDINESFYVKTDSQQYFIKIKSSPPPRFFICEKIGLETIRKTNTISVPNVFHVNENEQIGYLVLEWVSGDKTEKTPKLLGHRLAQMHSITKDRFGFQHDSYIGMLPQPNGWFHSWIDYYREYKLLPQIKLAKSKRYLNSSLDRKLHKLLERLDEWLPSQPKASLLHGDLWGGNWIVGKNGDPYLIDPSIFYGHDEFELAFTELFGGFPETFYNAYTEVNPLSRNYKDRKPIYQLFYILVHVNLFGESYLRSVERIVNYYT